MNFKGGKTITELMVTQKDKDTILQKNQLKYRYKFGRVDCKEYIGEYGRTFAECFKEHLKANSPTYDHCNTTGHTMTVEKFRIVGNEEQNLARLIKEANFHKG